jgi:hypothetical protein
MKRLGFGLMRLPFTNEYNNVDIEAVKKLVDRFIKQGFAYFDTAYIYHGGNSETAFREAVARRYSRDSYVIANKMPMWMIQSQEQLSQIFDEQLARCGVEFFDYYLLHNLNRKDYQTVQKVNAFQFVEQKKREGKIRRIGFSFHDNARILDQILTEHPETEFVQLQLNYVDMDDIGIESGKCHGVAVKHGKEIIVMEPLKGGSLANVPSKVSALFKGYNPDATIASWALRYAASFENVVMVLSGMNSMEQLADNMNTMEDFKAINKEEQPIIQKAAEIIKADIAIPCTECRYCVEDCPQTIAIPEYFTIYNNLRRFEATQQPIAEVYYDNLAQSYGKASDCTECGVCEDSCPQRLSIRAHLKEVAAAFETAND